MGEVKQVKNPYFEAPSQTTKTVTVEPSEESKATSLSMPTDPALLQQLQKDISQAQKTWGIDPKTGQATPFEVLGYNPEEERKRREAERALNDAKRKENAWYNAFAVLGDSLTAALGGNVWSRQPNNIGAKANADNARLLAEQKAEDEANQGKLRAASAGYSDTVNKLIQNYLTKTVTTSKTGGGRTEVIYDPGKSGYRYSSHVVGTGSNGYGSGKGKYINVNVTGEDGSISKNRYDVTEKQYKALQGILKEYYNSILQKNDEHARKLEDFLTRSHVIKGTDSQGQYIYDNDQLLQNGHFWMLDDATKDRIERELDGKIRFKTRSGNASSAENAQDDGYDPDVSKNSTKGGL